MYILFLGIATTIVVAFLIALYKVDPTYTPPSTAETGQIIE